LEWSQQQLPLARFNPVIQQHQQQHYPKHGLLPTGFDFCPTLSKIRLCQYLLVQAKAKQQKEQRP
jgi:hypothetical protein